MMHLERSTNSHCSANDAQMVAAMVGQLSLRHPSSCPTFRPNRTCCDRADGMRGLVGRGRRAWRNPTALWIPEASSPAR